jgi:hypothetical protein
MILASMDDEKDEGGPTSAMPVIRSGCQPCPGMLLFRVRGRLIKSGMAYNTPLLAPGCFIATWCQSGRRPEGDSETQRSGYRVITRLEALCVIVLPCVALFT